MELLFFTSKTCMACKQLLPRLQAMTKIKITIIDVEQSPEIVTNYSVSSLPTVLYIVDNKPQKQLTGSVSEKVLREWLDEIE